MIRWTIANSFDRRRRFVYKSAGSAILTVGIADTILGGRNFGCFAIQSRVVLGTDAFRLLVDMRMIGIVVTEPTVQAILIGFTSSDEGLDVIIRKEQKKW